MKATIMENDGTRLRLCAKKSQKVSRGGKSALNHIQSVDQSPGPSKGTVHIDLNLAIVSILGYLFVCFS